MMAEKLLRPKEVAAELGVQVGSIYRWIQAGHLRALRFGQNRKRGPVVIRESDFRAFVEKAALDDS